MHALDIFQPPRRADLGRAVHDVLGHDVPLLWCGQPSKDLKRTPDTLAFGLGWFMLCPMMSAMGLPMVEGTGLVRFLVERSWYTQNQADAVVAWALWVLLLCAGVALRHTWLRLLTRHTIYGLTARSAVIYSGFPRKRLTMVDLPRLRHLTLEPELLDRGTIHFGRPFGGLAFEHVRHAARVLDIAWKAHENKVA